MNIIVYSTFANAQCVVINAKYSNICYSSLHDNSDFICNFLDMLNIEIFLINFGYPSNIILFMLLKNT